jgi:hypothetical protein
VVKGINARGAFICASPTTGLALTCDAFDLARVNAVLAAASTAITGARCFSDPGERDVRLDTEIVNPLTGSAEIIRIEVSAAAPLLRGSCDATLSNEALDECSALSQALSPTDAQLYACEQEALRIASAFGASCD